MNQSRPGITSIWQPPAGVTARRSSRPAATEAAAPAAAPGSLPWPPAASGWRPGQTWPARASRRTLLDLAGYRGLARSGRYGAAGGRAGRWRPCDFGAADSSGTR